MDKFKTWGLTIAIAVLAVISSASLFLQKELKTLLVKPGLIGTNITQQTSNGSYTDSADFRQNAQAVFERFANGSSGQLLQADSNGKLQLVNTSALTGAWTLPSLTVTGATTLSGSLIASSTNIASTLTTTLTVSDSGKTFYIGGTTSTVILPATSSLTVGTNFRFVVGSALSVSSTIVTVTGANEIEGTLIVAGAVVDCDAEDTITLGASVENIGDYLVLTWSGTYWMLGDSGALTATALACTAT